MITDKDFKSLKGPSSRVFSSSIILLLCLIGLFLYAAFRDISLAFHYAEQIGLDTNALLSLWNSEPDLNRTYSGYEQQLIHRLNMAIIDTGVVIIMSIQLVTFVLSRRRNQRILDALGEAGVTPND